MKSLVTVALSAALLSGSAFAAMAPGSEACTAKETRDVSVLMAGQTYRVTVDVRYYEPDGTLGQEPVIGAAVFNLETNQLYGHTGPDGLLHIQVAAGTRLRVVEPIYGVQQYEGVPIYNDKGEVIGWKRPD